MSFSYIFEKNREISKKVREISGNVSLLRMSKVREISENVSVLRMSVLRIRLYPERIFRPYGVQRPDSLGLNPYL